MDESRTCARFRDRVEAGGRLAEGLSRLDVRDPVVLGLPRGGVPVAREVAAALGAPFDVFVARKLGAPGNEELGIGAVAEGSDEVVVTDAAWRLGIDARRVRALAELAGQELRRRVEVYRQGRELPRLTGRDVILVDDGLATGVTAEAALRALRHHAPRRLILAVPVCAPQTLSRLVGLADHLVCVLRPADLVAVGFWYEDFSQITDEQVVALLRQGLAHTAAPTGRAG